MLKQIERSRKAEQRTYSEFVREAVRFYLKRSFPVVKTSAAEVRALRRARAESDRGEYVTLDQLLHELGISRRSLRKKNSLTPSAERPPPHRLRVPRDGTRPLLW